MLVLSRKTRERVRCRCPDGCEIWIEVLDFGRERVRLGLTAPASVELMREELIAREEVDHDQ